jgi:hypothetical protein
MITIKNYLFLVTVHYTWNVQLDDGSILNIYRSWNIYNHCVWLYTFSIKGGDGVLQISPQVLTQLEVGSHLKKEERSDL